MRTITPPPVQDRINPDQGHGSVATKASAFETTVIIRKKRLIVAVHSADPHLIDIQPIKRTAVVPWSQLRMKHVP